MTTLLNTLRLAAPAVAAFALAAPAQAALVGYTDAASFMAAVLDVGTDSYDDLPAFAVVDTPTVRSTSPVVYSYSVDALTGLFGLNNGGDGLLSTNDLFDPLLFSTFSSGVAAAGLVAFGTDFDGFAVAGVTVNVTAVDTLGDMLVLTTANATPDSFFGFTSTAQISTLTVEVVSLDNVYATANNLMLAAVPEPGTYALMLGGLGLVSWLARRRRAD